MTWSEAGSLEVGGLEVAPGLQWYLADHRGSMAYLSRLFVGSGTIAGRRVRGFCGYDEAYRSPGRVMYVDDPMVTLHPHDFWCTWGLEVEHEAEVGHVAFGPDGFGFAVWCDREGVHEARSVEGKVERDAQGRPRRVEVQIDGAAWLFSADETARTADPDLGPISQAEGRFRRVADDRETRSWFASVEAPRPAE